MFPGRPPFALSLSKGERSIFSSQLENGDWLTGRPRTPGDAQRQGHEEKLITVLLGTGRYQAFGIDIINQTQPQQGNPQMDTKIEPVIPDRAFIQQIPGNASHVTFAEWMRMDVNYIRRRNLVHDVKILAQTIPAVLLRRGAR